MLLLRDAAAGIPHLDVQRIAPTPAAEQHAAAPRVAHRVGQEVLQHAPEQLRIRVDHVLVIGGPQLQSSVAGDHGEFGRQGLDHLSQGKVFQARLLSARVQAGDIEQAAQQVLGRDQRRFGLAHQRAAGRQQLRAVDRRDEQARCRHRLNQVVRCRSEKARLRLVGLIGRNLGLGQLAVECRQLAGALHNPILERLIRLLERALCALVGGDVGIAGHESAARHRIAENLQDLPVRQLPLVRVRLARAHVCQAPRDGRIRSSIGRPTATMPSGYSNSC